MSAQFSGTERFRLDCLLGRGATGVVYAAFDRQLTKAVALKLLTNWHPLGIERFKNEFRALQGVRHKNLVELRELLFDEQHWFLTMELVRGSDFLSYVRGSVPVGPAAGYGESEASPTDDTLAGGTSARVLAPRAVEEAANFDEQRLREAFAQLAAGLAALHAAGKIHRDVKPSNVLVDAHDRVVIVDFGLVAHVDAESSAERAPLLGTPRYMSPEQAVRGKVGPASDWYSAGALLYEALTGRLPPSPLPGPSDRAELLPPREICARAPDDLSELCLRLLATAPESRPSGAEVLRLLRGEPRALVSSSAPLGGGTETTFVGRVAELSVLDAAFERVRSGAAVSLVIEGQSGVGKTTLMREFAERVRRLQPAARCFSGRCFERESLPYKAVDGVMDAVGEYLSQRSDPEITRLLPRSAGVIGQVFPVLRRLPGLAAAMDDLSRVDPQLQRLRFFAALRELFVRLAAEQPTLVLLDDMQWSDIDSLSLLSALLEPPGAPRLLLLAAKRPGGAFDERSLPGPPLRMTLGNLSQAESEALLAALLPEPQRRTESRRIALLTHEAQGHPLFLRELARQFDSAPRADGGKVRLDDALWQRIEALPRPARRLVELTAVAGQPLAQSTIFEALAFGEAEPGLGDLAWGELDRHLADVRHACLLRTSGARPSDSVEPYHDRIREAVLGRLDAGAKKQHHSAIARALEQSHAPDPEALAGHFLAADETERARHYAIAAADQAQAALAFERAARLYRLALSLGTLEVAARRELGAKLAESLASAGRGFEAAEAYAQAGEGDDSLPGLHRQRLAAEQLLRSGHIEAGMTAVSRVLRKLELPVPSSSLTALLSLLTLRARLALRGFGYVERSAEQVSPLELARIDGLWTAATCLTMFDNARSAELQCRGILRALNGGTSLQVLRAHTAESIFLATAGEPNRRAIERVLGAATTLAEHLRDPYALGWIGLSRGATAFLLGDWQQGEEQCRAAEEVFRERAGAQWELGSARAFGTWSAMMRGSFGQIAVRVPGYVDEAEKRGDLYAATLQMTGFSNVAWLCRHDVPTARRMLGLAEQRWPGTRFDVPRYLNMIAAASVELYEGAGRAAHARVLRDWAALRWGLAFRAQLTRFGMRTMRGLSALAAYDEARDVRLLADAEACARAIAAEEVTWSGSFAALILAGALQRRGAPERAILQLSVAEQKADATGMVLHRAVARLRRGELVGGDEGRALVSDARGFMHGEGIVEVEPMANMLTARSPFPQ